VFPEDLNRCRNSDLLQTRLQNATSARFHTFNLFEMEFQAETVSVLLVELACMSQVAVSETAISCSSTLELTNSINRSGRRWWFLFTFWRFVVSAGIARHRSTVTGL
jgi:hypothetical protein